MEQIDKMQGQGIIRDSVMDSSVKVRCFWKTNMVDGYGQET